MNRELMIQGLKVAHEIAVQARADLYNDNVGLAHHRLHDLTAQLVHLIAGVGKGTFDSAP